MLGVYVERVTDSGVARGTVKSKKLKLREENLRKCSCRFLETYVPLCPSL